MQLSDVFVNVFAPSTFVVLHVLHVLRGTSGCLCYAPDHRRRVA